MRTLCTSFFVISTLAALAVTQTPSSGNTYHGKLDLIRKGVEFRLRYEVQHGVFKRIWVRIYGIGVPKNHEPQTERALHKILNKKEVFVGRYLFRDGVVVGQVMVFKGENSVEVAEQLVQTGAASALPNTKTYNIYSSLEAKARKKHLGIWAKR